MRVVLACVAQVLLAAVWRGQSRLRANSLRYPMAVLQPIAFGVDGTPGSVRKSWATTAGEMPHTGRQPNVRNGIINSIVLPKGISGPNASGAKAVGNANRAAGRGSWVSTASADCRDRPSPLLNRAMSPEAAVLQLY